MGACQVNVVSVNFILASTSKYRNSSCKEPDFFFLRGASCNEDTLKKVAPADPRNSPVFGIKKAESLIEKYPKDWIVGCDQAAAAGKVVLNKPGSHKGSVQQLPSFQENGTGS